MTTKQQDAVDRARQAPKPAPDLPEPTAEQVLQALQQSHPDAVNAAYWRVRATLAERAFHGGATLEAIDPRG